MGWIRKRQDRPSPWRAGYRGPAGREHSRSFERKVDAERWLRGELQKVDLGIWVDPEAGNISLEDSSVMWMSGRVGLTEKTRTGYHGILNSRVLPAFGALTIKRGLALPSPTCPTRDSAHLGCATASTCWPHASTQLLTRV